MRNGLRMRAKGLGFDLCGIVAPREFPELAHFEDWLGRGYHGEMKYLEDARRRDLSLVMDPLRSIIVCGLNYNTAHPYSVETELAADTFKPHTFESKECAARMDFALCVGR